MNNQGKFLYVVTVIIISGILGMWIFSSFGWIGIFIGIFFMSILDSVLFNIETKLGVHS